MLSQSRQQSGFTMVELMVGLTVGLILFAGVLAVYINTVESSTDNLGVAHLNQELRATMGVITRDLRRAGYWAATPGVHNLAANPFTQVGDDIVTGAFTGEPANSCVTYTYDLDKDRMVGVGLLGTADPTHDQDNVEQFGFRLRNDAIEMRSRGAAFDCINGIWEDVTDPTTEITALSFTVNATDLNITNPGNACVAGQGCQTIRQVDITLSGRLSNDNTVQQTINDSVRLRNDRFVP